MTAHFTSTAKSIAIESLSVITYQNNPVVTTELLAQLYGTARTNIHDNYRKNSDRFIEGKHFFKLEGESLREFNKSVTGKFPVTRSRNLTLWTKRGSARHAKMLDTEQAWDVFERMEDCYFSRQTNSASSDFVNQANEFAELIQAKLIKALPSSPYKPIQPPKCTRPGKVGSKEGNRNIETTRVIIAELRDGAYKELPRETAIEVEVVLDDLQGLMTTCWTEVDEALQRFEQGMFHLNRWQSRNGRVGNAGG